MENLLMVEGYCRYVTTLSCVRHHGTNPHFNHGITLLFFTRDGLNSVSKVFFQRVNPAGCLLRSIIPGGKPAH
jgi:hypothetical protein